MIHSVTVDNNAGDILTLELGRPARSGFAVKKIDGLGPPVATINRSGTAVTHGSRFNSSRMIDRNIVLTLVFGETPTIEATRLLSYKMFPVSEKIKLTVVTDKRVAVIEGYVESNEPDIFSPQESSVVSIICPEPLFRDGSDAHEVSFYNVRPVFEFPFSNEHATNKLLVMGEYEDSTSREIVYDGDHPAGVIFDIAISGTVQNLTIHNPGTGEGMTIQQGILTTITTPLETGDRIVIDTRRGSRSATLLRGATTINILHALGPKVAWLSLRPGVNLLKVEATAGVSNARVVMTYDKLYKGV